MFHGETNAAAVLRVRKANWNSPISAKSGRGSSVASALEVDNLELQLLRLKSLNETFVEEGFANSTQPLADTNPPKPTAPKS
jgi:hypothetical protein